MRNILWSCLALAALTWSHGAVAGTIPFDSTAVCVDGAGVADLFDPNAFNHDGLAQKDCRKLCAQSASYCKKFAKGSASCTLGSFKGFYALIDKASCDAEEDPNDRAECHAQVKGFLKGVKDSFPDFVASSLASCDDFLDECEADCVPIK